MNRLACLPLFHAAQAPFTHTTTLRSGRESYIMKRFQLHDYLENTRKFGITHIVLVPPMVVAIVNLAKDRPDYVKKCLQSVRAGVGGAAPLDAETQKELIKLLPKGTPFTQLWAMSETSCIASYFYYPEADNTASVGRFLPCLDVKVVDEDENEIDPPYDRRGELCIRGPTVIRGYLDNPEANQRDWDRDGFFHTGDIAYCDSKTKLWYIVDRRKELIKVRGFQVAPSELEGVLLSHPEILDVAVIGIPAAENGSELPKAYVIKKPGSNIGEKDVKAWIQERLAKYKALDGGVKFVDSIPKTASGKILKRVLREEVRREMGPKL
jgi:4-coumarate--CoA ligase